MELYDKDLFELHKKAERFKNLELLLDDLYEQRSTLQMKVSDYKILKEIEEKDVRELEGRSLSAFFYHVVGKMDKKLDEERKQAYEATVKYDAAVRELEAVDEDIFVKLSEKSSLRGAVGEYEAALHEKTEALKTSDNPLAEQIYNIEQKIARIDAELVEVKDALDAGNAALFSAVQFRSTLYAAENWGFFDAKGGVLNSFIKRGDIDRAQDQVEQLQVDLRRFRTELIDIRMTAEVSVDIDEFLNVAETLFDEVFAGFDDLSKIREVKAQTDAAIANIKHMTSRLSLYVSIRESAKKELSDSLDSLVMNA